MNAVARNDSLINHFALGEINGSLSVLQLRDSFLQTSVDRQLSFTFLSLSPDGTENMHVLFE